MAWMTLQQLPTMSVGVGGLANLLQIITLVACMIAGIVFLVRGLPRQQQRAQIHVENVVEAPLAAVDGPTVLDEADDEFMQENIVGQMVQV